MLYDEVLKDIEEKKINREQGNFNGIPLCFPRYREYVPSIDKGIYYGLLGSTGVGKSRVCRHMFVYEPLKFSLETGYPLKILYFALEDGKHKIFKKIISHYLWEMHKIYVPAPVLESKDKPLPDYYLQYIRKDREFFKKFEDIVHIINDRLTPKEIYEACISAHDTFGKTHHILVIIDNYSNIIKEKKHFNDWEAIKELSRDYVRLRLCKERDMSVVAILQQDMESEKATFRAVGQKGIAALEPNMGSIGENKIISHDIMTLWAIFNPWRYEIEHYPHIENGYNTGILRNKFRSLILLKNNEGEAAPRAGLYFEGGKEIFSEMPLITDKNALDQLYRDVEQEQKDRVNRIMQNKIF